MARKHIFVPLYFTFDVEQYPKVFGYHFAKTPVPYIAVLVANICKFVQTQVTLYLYEFEKILKTYCITGYTVVTTDQK